MRIVIVGKLNFNDYNRLVSYSFSTLGPLKLSSSNSSPELLLFSLKVKSKRQKETCVSLIPVKVYENADIDKHRVLLENDGKSGIYLWTNLLNGDRYIGSGNNLKKRLNSYYNMNYLMRYSSRYIHRALLKYGYSNFSLSILEYCDKSVLINREQYYFDILMPEYNICKTAGSTQGITHSDETKIKISLSKLGTNQKEDNSMFGNIHTEEARMKMSERKIGRKLSEEVKVKLSAAAIGRKFTEEHKEKLSASKKNSKKLSVLDLKTGQETIYDSVNQANKVLNLPKDAIRANLRSKRNIPYKGEYIFKLLDE